MPTHPESGGPEPIAGGRFIRDIIRERGRTFSFEFFPPKTDAGMDALWRVITEDLAPLDPAFVSVTYGAGGSTRDNTIHIVRRIAQETSITPMAHLTTVLAGREEIHRVVTELAEAGVRNILALRGDPPRDMPDYDRGGDEFAYAADLVEFIHEHAAAQFCVGVAAFPECHPLAPDLETDVANFVAKVNAGADFAITQFFFEAHHYWRYRELADRHGMPGDVPVIPGIIPVTNLAQVQRIAQLSGADFPGWLFERLAAAGDDPDTVHKVGVDQATELCRELLDGGAPGIHFYTLNKSPATRQIFANLQGR